MGDQLASGAEALRLFFTDDIYLIQGDEAVEAVYAALPETQVPPVQAAAAQAGSVTATIVETESSAAPVPAAVAEPVKVANVVEIPSVTTVPAAPSFKYLGKNQKNVLILVNDKENETSTERGRELLRNIVKALQLSANDFALVNYTVYENTPLQVLTAFFSSKLVLSFGVAPEMLGLAAQPANLLIREGDIELVFSKNLDPLAEDLAEKKALWGSLKQIKLT